MPGTRSQEGTQKLQLRSRQVKCSKTSSNQNKKPLITKNIGATAIARRLRADDLFEA